MVIKCIFLDPKFQNLKFLWMHSDFLSFSVYYVAKLIDLHILIASYDYDDYYYHHYYLILLLAPFYNILYFHRSNRPYT